MTASIFRKSALEKLSSPEQLNDYLRVNQPRGWLVLLGLFAMLAAAGVWVFRGSIPETARLKGMVFASEGPVRTCFGFAELKTARRLKAGMKAQVSPEHAPRNEYGFIYGTVTRVGQRPASDEELIGTFGSLRLDKDLLPLGDRPVLVEIELERSGGRLRWSNRKGTAVDVPNFSDCSILVVTRERRPYELVFD